MNFSNPVQIMEVYVKKEIQAFEYVIKSYELNLKY